MGRTSRIIFPNAFYHVMNRGGARRMIFQSDKQRQMFLDFLKESGEAFGLEVHAYCLMDNHFHLLVRSPQANLSEAIHWITNQFVRRVIREARVDGPIFRGRFRAIVVAADDYLVQVSPYIHLNPIKAKICEHPLGLP